MIEPWFMYAVFSFFLVGIYGFLQKVEADSSLNTNSFIVYAHSGCIILPLIYVLFLGGTFVFDLKLVLFAMGINLLYVFALKARIRSLKVLSSSEFFINYRIGSSALLIILGQIFFQEHISLKEYIGIFIGFIIFYLLLEKDSKKSQNKDMIYGYMYLLLSILLITGIWLLMKQYVVLSDADVVTYIFSAGMAGIFGTLFMKGKDSLSQVLIIKKKKHILFVIFTTSIFTLGIFTNMSAIAQDGDLAIVYKILSYSLFIPIILSVIVYKEKIGMNKIIAFGLTVVSILLFI